MLKSLLHDDTGGADVFRSELLRELVLDLRESELWLRDLGRSAAIAASSATATGQNHSWCSCRAAAVAASSAPRPRIITS